MTSNAIGAPIGTTNIVERSIRFTRPNPTTVAAPPYAQSASTAPLGADDDVDAAARAWPHARPTAIITVSTTTSTSGRAVAPLTGRCPSRAPADRERPRSTTRRSDDDAGRVQDATSRPTPRSGSSARRPDRFGTARATWSRVTFGETPEIGSAEAGERGLGRDCLVVDGGPERVLDHATSSMR